MYGEKSGESMVYNWLAKQSTCMGVPEPGPCFKNPRNALNPLCQRCESDGIFAHGI